MSPTVNRSSLTRSVLVCVCLLPGMVFAGLYPSSSYDFDSLLIAVNKLTLNDASVSIQRESSEALGLGLRVGFLGLLHMDVFCTRLEQEFNASVIATQPSVPYIAVLDDGSELHIDTPAKFPSDSSTVAYYLEPYVRATLIAPAVYQGDLMTLCQSRRGVLVDVVQLGSSGAGRVSVVYRMPLAEVVQDFYSSVKSLTSGYASFDYEEEEQWVEADVVRVDVRLNGNSVDALSTLCPRSEADTVGRRMVDRLRTLIQQQQFEVVIQAAVGNKVLARQRVAPYRKDVLHKSGKTVGGGDVTRKKKLLEKQKAGKRRLKVVGNVELGEEVFASFMKRDDGH